LLLAHYARWDVVSKYPIDGIIESCHSEGFICKGTALELKVNGSGKVYHVTLPPDAGEVDELSRAAGTGRHVRIFCERRAIWIPWEGSTRQAVGVDWLAPGGVPVVIVGDGGTEAARSDRRGDAQTP
jgi:hypothetical protein